MSRARRSLALLLLALAVTGCASSEKRDVGLVRTGPVVLAMRNPDVIELNWNLEPTRTEEIIAEVRDSHFRITDVKLRFIHAPLEVPLKPDGQGFWRTNLTSEQIKMLAVGGQVMTYDANIIARNESGQIGMSQEPLQIAISAPDLSAVTRGTLNRVGTGAAR